MSKRAATARDEGSKKKKIVRTIGRVWRFSVTEYFKGSNWKVHPDWVYCEYSSASEKWFPSPEERVLHFLARTRSPGWKWMSLRPRSPSSHHKQASKPDKDAYYCKLERLDAVREDKKAITHCTVLRHR